MASIKDIIKNIPEPKKGKASEEEQEDVMMNSEYLRHSSSIISEALKKGFDVLQLENGDIVTTGTKVIVTQYHWDGKQQSMVKLSAKERKKIERGEEDGDE